MKEVIINLLVGKYGGVSRNILERIAEKKAKGITSEEQAKEVAESITFQQILESYGDSRATESQQTAVANYERKYNLKDGKSLEDPKTEGNPSPANEESSVEALIKELQEQNRLLSRRLDSISTEKITETRKGQLSAIISKLPETLRNPYSRLDVSGYNEEEFKSFLGEVGNEVEGVLKDMNVKGATFTPPASYNSGKKEDLSEEEIKAISKREGVLTDDEQPF